MRITPDRVEGLAAARVLVVGDLMVDRWIRGTAERLSPEAPVPVIRQHAIEETCGGAGNVRQWLVALKAEALLLSGDLFDPDWQLPVKTRVMAGSQQVCRIDDEIDRPLSEEGEARMLDRIAQELPRYDVIAVADYGKGTITPAIARRLVESGKPVLVDCKTRWRLYSGALLVKPNRRELADIIGHPLEDEAGVRAAAHQLLASGAFGAVLVTMGADGMVLVRPGSDMTAAARNVAVADVTGAGDAVLASLAVAIARGWDMPDAVRLANSAGALAVSRPGTAPVTLEELAADCPALPNSGAIEALRETVARRRAQGVPIFLVNGCFDLLHAGHRHLLRTARKAAAASGAFLVAAVNDDASVARIKGAGRPMQPADVRADAIRDQVDGAIIVHDTMAALAAIRPDKVFKGNDHTDDDAEGRFVTTYGGEVVLVPRLPDHSTTAAIARLHAGR